MSQFREPTSEQIRDGLVFRTMGLTAQEYEQIAEIIGRLPNYTETGLYSVMWSEHCSYKNSKPVLSKFPTTGPNVLQGPGEGAGIVDIGDGQGVVFKMESHNHPSAIEPYQGAATGVGGIIRDVFSMGARPVALLNSLRFGELDSAKVRYLFTNVVAGIAGYGNCVGIPTVGGEVYFDRCYEGNPLVNAMCVGIIDQDKIQKGVAAGVGNPIIYVGASTGRDGIHGATFASEELSEASEQKRPAVQVGDPFMEKLLLEACLEFVETGALEGIQDMGAAGLASSSCEMASKAGNGMVLFLDQVPQRESNMSAYEMLLSESQERMLLAVKKGREEEIAKICEKWGLQYAEIGQVTADCNYRVYHKGELVADVPVDSLAQDAPVYHRPSRVPKYYQENQDLVPVEYSVDDLNLTLENLLSSPTIASKRWVYSQYDSMVRTSTAVLPGSDAAVIRVRGTNKALAMVTDCNSRYIYLDPKVGGAIAVAEAARNLVCSGAEPLALTDCLNFGSPENPEVFWQLEQAVDGMSEACRALAVPVVSGNVSLYNERSGQAIFPTPIVGMVGLISDLESITTMPFKMPGDIIVLLGDSYPEFGGSELQKLKSSAYSGRPPQIDLAKEQSLQDLMLQMIGSGWIRSAHDLAEGGLGVALAESAIASGLGVSIQTSSSLDATAFLFAESQSRIIITVQPKDLENALQSCEQAGVSAVMLGKVCGNQDFVVEYNEQSVITTTVDRIRSCWEDAIPCIMKS